MVIPVLVKNLYFRRFKINFCFFKSQDLILFISLMLYKKDIARYFLLFITLYYNTRTNNYSYLYTKLRCNNQRNQISTCYLFCVPSCYLSMVASTITYHFIQWHIWQIRWNNNWIRKFFHLKMYHMLVFHKCCLVIKRNSYFLYIAYSITGI